MFDWVLLVPPPFAKTSALFLPAKTFESVPAAVPVKRVHVAYVLTLPLISSVQSPAGIIMPALATEAVAKIAPAAVFLIKNFAVI